MQVRVLSVARPSKSIDSLYKDSEDHAGDQSYSIDKKSVLEQSYRRIFTIQYRETVM